MYGKIIRYSVFFLWGEGAGEVKSGKILMLLHITLFLKCFTKNFIDTSRCMLYCCCIENFIVSGGVLLIAIQPIQAVKLSHTPSMV